MTTALYQKLKLPKLQSDISILGVGNQPTPVRHHVQATIFSQITGDPFLVDCYIMPKITGSIPNWPVNENDFQIPSDIEMADPNWANPQPVDLLICGDVYWASFLNRTIQLGPGLPHLRETVFGYVIVGEHRPPANDIRHVCHNQATALDDILRRFWEVEEFPTEPPLTDEQRLAEEHFVKSHKRTPEGRFQVQLPFKEDPNCLDPPRDFSPRLNSTLGKNPELGTSSSFSNPIRSAPAFTMVIKKRGGVISAVTRVEKYISELSESELTLMVNRTMLQGQMDLVKSMKEKYAGLQQQLVAEMSDDELIDQELEAQTAFFQRCDNIVSKIGQILEALPEDVKFPEPSKPSTSSSSSSGELLEMMKLMLAHSDRQNELQNQRLQELFSAQNGNGGRIQPIINPSVTKLPHLNTPTFDGRFAEWYSFRDRFTSSISNHPSLSDVQKLEYLQSSLKGYASSLVKNLPTTEAIIQLLGKF
uniref:Uncharacterized protein n=1 Tax=Phlebotomus papatasi TaxID=29031 RepID=A0A1B0DIJ9_PHLPP